MPRIDFRSQLTHLATLQTAWQKVADNHGGPGADGITVETYRAGLKKKLTALSRCLERGTFQSAPYRRHEIPKDNGKVRRLMVPCIEDRIVHTAIAQTLSPILEPQFEDSSFAYRPGRSVKQAVAAIERWRDAGYQHVIDADITNYFDSIDHKILLTSLKRHVSNHESAGFLIDLVAELIEHQGMELETLGKGLAQGSPLSPLLANLYLDHLDEKIERRGVRIIRFADDFVILCKSIKSTDRALEELKEVLDELELELHPKKTRLVSFDRGFEFLGYLFVRSLAMQQADEDIDIIWQIPQSPKSPQAKEKEAFEPLAETKGRTDYAKGDRILYVLERDRRIVSNGQNIEVTTDEGRLILGIGSNRVDRIEIGPAVQIDQTVLALCMTNNIQLVFLNGWGQQQGRLVTNEDDRSALQFMQAQACASSDIASILSRRLVDARIRNQRAQLFRLNRRQENPEVEHILKAMGRNLRKLPHLNLIAEMRGLEGASGALYWPALGLLCKGAAKPFRRTRPAKDAANAAINFSTFMLERDIRSAIRSAGLHVGFGFLHKPTDYSEAAVYDLMEPFRAPLTEGLIAYLFNAKRLRQDMFSVSEKGTVWMEGTARKAIIKSYEQAVAKQVNIPGQKRKLAWRRMMWHQANSLANAYRKADPSLFEPYLMEA